MHSEHDGSKIFWTIMLPMSAMLAVILAALTQIQLQAGVILQTSRTCQSSLFMAVFLGMFALMGVRVTMYHALDEHCRFRAAVIGVLTLCVSASFIVYGVGELR